MTNSNEHSQEELRRHSQNEPAVLQSEKQNAEQIEHRHYAPIQAALRDEAVGYDWKRETGDIQSYQHRNHDGWLHIDLSGVFYDRQAQPISRETALEYAGQNRFGVLNQEPDGNKLKLTGDDLGLSI